MHLKWRLFGSRCLVENMTKKNRDDVLEKREMSIGLGYEKSLRRIEIFLIVRSYFL